MEDNRETPQGSLRRCYEVNRLEDALWTAAYEQIWPVIRTSSQRSRTNTQPRRQTGAARTPLARRA
jgi:hypothetical protein